MLPAIVLAALIASGLMLSKRDAVSAAPEALPAPPATRPTNPYAYNRVVDSARAADARAGAAAAAVREPVAPRTVYSPLRGMNVPVEDMELGLAPHYSGSAPLPMKDREPARAPDPKRECVETRGWDSQAKPGMEAVLNAEAFAVAGSLSATRQGELLQQPYRERRPEPEELARPLPPTVDVLRGGARPRYVDKGRIIPGSAPIPSRESPINVPKRTPDSFRTTSSADMVPNTGPAERPDLRGTQVIAATARGLGATNYMPAAAASSRWAGVATADTHVARPETAALQVGGASRSGAWSVDSQGDLGAAQYAGDLRDNERGVLPIGVQVGALPMVGIKAGPGASYVSPDRERTDWNVKTLTTSAPRLYGNVRGDTALKATMYDPNMSMRTTLKETLIHDTTTGIAGPRADRTQARDPDDDLSPTVRNTLASVDSNANLAPPNVKPLIYDPDDLYEPTGRDTLGDAGRTGLPDTTPEGAGYMSADVDAKRTQRQFQLTDYTGIADAEGGDGYKTADVDARQTQREFVGNAGVEFGPGGAVNSKKSSSYAAMYAARMRSIKESVLQGRAPTQVGPALVKGSQDPDLRVESSRDPYLEQNHRQEGYRGRQGAMQTQVQPECRNDTRRVNALRVCNDRNDGFTETAALRLNPYNLDVTRPSAPPIMHRGVGNTA